MKEALINEVVQSMLPYLDNGQLVELKKSLRQALQGKTIFEEEIDIKKKDEENRRLTELFIAAKRVEGCSEKSIKYYSVTIDTMLSSIQKDIKRIVTDDL